MSETNVDPLVLVTRALESGATVQITITPRTPSQDDLVAIVDAASRAHCSVWTLRQWVRRLGVTLVGGQRDRSIRVRDLDKIIAARAWQPSQRPAESEDAAFERWERQQAERDAPKEKPRARGSGTRGRRSNPTTKSGTTTCRK